MIYQLKAAWARLRRRSARPVFLLGASLWVSPVVVFGSFFDLGSIRSSGYRLR